MKPKPEELGTFYIYLSVRFGSSYFRKNIQDFALILSLSLSHSGKNKISLIFSNVRSQGFKLT